MYLEATKLYADSHTGGTERLHMRVELQEGLRERAQTCFNSLEEYEKALALAQEGFRSQVGDEQKDDFDLTLPRRIFSIRCSCILFLDAFSIPYTL